MSAKEMFEKLGYKLNKQDKTEIIYLNEDDDLEIIFYIDIRLIGFRDTNELTFEELQAINKQCEELGWLDD